MMKSSQNMFWSDVNDAKHLTENIEANKEKSARKTPSVILGAVQLMENFIKGIKQMNAYDASSTIISDANWIQKSMFNAFYDENGNEVQIELGKVYYLDYGKSFCGEMAYFHYGLCIGKRDGKILIVPMTSNKNQLANIYHPINNPNGNKKNRQALESEGFNKDCVLKINDTKYISAGRIEKETAQITNEILYEIQMQVFQVQFPRLYTEFLNNQKMVEKYKLIEAKQKEEIIRLKAENNRCNQLLNNQIKRNVYKKP